MSYKGDKMKKYLLILLIALLLISPVCAGHTIIVDEKRVEGTQDSPLFVIGQIISSARGTSVVEYPVLAQDYEKINHGDMVTLELDASHRVYNIVKVGK